MNILRNVTEGISPLNWGGFKPGEMTIYSGGRGAGKSLYYNHNLRQEIMLTGQTSLTEMTLRFDASFSKPEKVNKYKFSRKWHIVDFYWKDYDAIHEWCEERFGPHPKNPDAWCRWHQRSMGQIHFRDEQDAAMFVLRWS